MQFIRMTTNDTAFIAMFRLAPEDVKLPPAALVQQYWDLKDSDKFTAVIKDGNRGVGIKYVFAYFLFSDYPENPIPEWDAAKAQRAQVEQPTRSNVQRNPAPVQTSEEDAMHEDTRETDGRGFNLNQGHGWVFYKVGREDTFLFAGHLRFGETRDTERQLVCRLNTQDHKYHCQIRNFGVERDGKPAWAELASFELPQIGSKQWVEAKASIPVALLGEQPKEEETPDGKIIKTKREVTIRAWKHNKPTRDGRPSMRVRIIGIGSDAQGQGTFNNVPM